MKMIRKYFNIKWFKENSLLLLIIFLALFLRILNPFFGFPALYVVSDEVNNYLSALYMLSQGSIVSTTSVYTPFGAYIQIPFIVISYLYMKFIRFTPTRELFSFYLATHEGALLFISRLISGIFGTLSIYLIYKVTLQIFPKKKYVATVASLLLATSINHVIISHFGRPWSPSLFFYLLAFSYLYKAFYSLASFSKNILVASIFILIVESFLQVGGFLIVLYIVLLLFNMNRKNLLSRNKGVILITFLIIGFGYYLLHSLTVVGAEMQSFYEPFRKGSLLDFLNFVYSNNTMFYYVYHGFTTEPLVIILFLIGLASPYSRKARIVPVAVFSLIYIVTIAFGQRHAIRYLLPATVLLIPYSAKTFVEITDKLPNIFLRRSLYLIVIPLLFFMPVLWNYRYLQVPTFIQAAEYIKKNFPADIAVASSSKRYMFFVPDRVALNDINLVNPKSYSELSKSIKINNNENIRRIYYLEDLDHEWTKSYGILLKKYNIKYLINMYWNRSEALSNTNTTLKSLKVFTPSISKENLDVYDMTIQPFKGSLPALLLNVERPGPIIEIDEVLY